MWESIIGMGSSCFVSCTDKKTVLKGYQVWENGKRRAFFPKPCEEALAREQFIYEHLGVHPQILHCFGLEEVSQGVHSLRLELAPLGNVRQFIEEHAPLPERTCVQMALDAATGLSHMHAQKVQHADLSCRNLFLFENYRIKIGDFGGSMIESYDFEETVCEEIQYELPRRGREFGDRPVIKRELFALGSAIYEIMAWTRPFQGSPDLEVEEKYAREEFPLVENIVLGKIIRNCWIELYENADEVVQAFQDYFIPLGDSGSSVLPPSTELS